MPSFEASIVERDFGGYRFAVVYLPSQLATELALRKRARCRGKIGSAAFAGALQPSQGLVSQALLKRSGCAVGDWVVVHFQLTSDDEVDVPAELAAALAARPGRKKKWEALTPGLRRSYAYRVASAKTPATRERRVDEVVAWVEDPSIRPLRGQTKL